MRAAPIPALIPALGLALAIGHGGVASAQLLPQMGAPVELGDLRTAFQRAYGPAGVGAAVGERNWTITPAIDVEVTATDNLRGLGTGIGGTRSSGDVITTITPSIAIQGASQRLTAALNYAPQIRSFLRNSSQNSVGQNLNASARATIFEDLLFLNASAYMTEYSRAGGLGAGSTGRLSRNDRVQTSSFSIGPQLRHAFSDIGVAEIGHTLTQTTQRGQALRANTPFAPAIIPGSTTTNSTQASFTSGQAFGRFNFSVTVVRVAYNGPGVLKNAYRNSEMLDLGYAVTREVTLLGQIGHQDLKYGGTRNIRINGANWSVGARWTPDPDSSFTVRYGYRDGGDNFSFEGTTAPTARTRISAAYSEGMANAAEELQNSIGRTQLSNSGITIDPTTGMPVILTNNFAGAQGGLARVKRISVSGVLTQEVDVFTISLNRDDRTQLSGDAIGGAPSISYMTIAAGWQRELGPGLRGNALASYGERSAAGFGGQQTTTFTAGLNWSLSETLSTRAAYTYTRATSSVPGFAYQANLVSVGLRKSF